MQNPNEKTPGILETGRMGLGLFVFAFQCLLRPLELLTTRPGSMGKRYLGSLTMGLGLLGFPFVCAFMADAARMKDGFGGVLYFWLLLIFARLVHLVRAGAYRRRYGHIHTFYEGLPLLPLRWPGKYEQNVLFGVAWTLGVGWLFRCPALAVYGVVAMFGFMVTRAWQEAHDDARIEAALDAAEDAEWVAGEVRRRRRTR
ncbi:MAG: hypothetical protein C0501_21295 [Isosphaera sp.]|nr:hypothetical protein [Isosphaera sp.]